MSEPQTLAATTLQDVGAFCNESRDLAAAINAYVDRWENYIASHQPPITERSRRKMSLAVMVLESAAERLTN